MENEWQNKVFWLHREYVPRLLRKDRFMKRKKLKMNPEMLKPMKIMSHKNKVESILEWALWYKWYHYRFNYKLSGH